MRKVAVMCAVGGCWLVPLSHATESASPNEDFLEYLAEFDTSGDNWTWFAALEDSDGKHDEQRATPPPTQQPERAKP